MVKKEATAKAAVNKVKEDVPARKRKASKYKSFRLQKKIPHPAGHLPTIWRLIGKMRRLLLENWKPILGIFLMYSVLNLVLVRNFSTPINVADIKENLTNNFGSNVGKGTIAGAIIGAMFGTTTTMATETSALYQVIILTIVSLALIWTFRQSSAGNRPTTKLAFYRGMYPLIPFLLILLVMAIQLLPATVGGMIFNFINSDQLAVGILEQSIWLLLFLSLVLLSIYMVCSSVFALYIVTLPDMSPMLALRSARNLVFSRRFEILRKMLAIPLLVLLVLIIVVVPSIYFLPVIAPWLYFLLASFSIVVLHAYMFVIYRELL